MAQLHSTIYLAPEEGERDVTTDELRAWLRELAQAGDDGTNTVQVRAGGRWRPLRSLRATAWQEGGAGVGRPQTSGWEAQQITPPPPPPMLPAGVTHEEYSPEEPVLPDHGADYRPIPLPNGDTSADTWPPPDPAARKGPRHAAPK